MDLPGFGDSDKTSPSQAQYNRAFFATHVWGLLDQLNITEKIHLLGHSMGGAVVTQMTLMQKDRIEKLILLDAMGVNIPPPFLGKIVMNPILGKAIFMKAYNRFMLKQYLLGDVFYRKEACTEALVDDMWRPLSTPEGKASAYATCKTRYTPIRFKHEQDLQKIDVETHLIWGEEDGFSHPRVAVRPWQSHQGQKLYGVGRHGTFSPEEMPQATTLGQVTACSIAAVERSRPRKPQYFSTLKKRRPLVPALICATLIL